MNEDQNRAVALLLAELWQGDILRSAVISLIMFAGRVKSAALPVPGVFRHGKAVAQSG